MLFPGAGLRLGSDDAPWGEPIQIATPDGETLSALLSPARPGRPTAIFFHGNADTTANYGFLAGSLAERGLGFLAVSYRGYGGSTGSPTEAGLLIDGAAAFDWLAAKHNGPVVLVGQSLGANVAVGVAARRPVSGLILISPSDSMAAVAKGHYPFLPVGSFMRDPFRSDLLIGQLRQPKLFLHGDRDTIIPARRGQSLFELAAEPKEFRLLQGYGHNDLWGPALVTAIADFVEAAATNPAPE